MHLPFTVQRDEHRSLCTNSNVDWNDDVILFAVAMANTKTEVFLDLWKLETACKKN